MKTGRSKIIVEVQRLATAPAIDVRQYERVVIDEIVESADRLPEGVRLSPRRREVGFIVHAWLRPNDPVHVPEINGVLRAYAVNPCVQADAAERGIKLIVAFNGRPELSTEAFSQHWREIHGPLAKRHHRALRRYVQNHDVVALLPSAVPVMGLAELWFDSVDAFVNDFYGTSHDAAAIAADSARFVDRPIEPFLVSTSHDVS